MIPQAAAAAQVLRLSALPFWPSTTAQHRAELIRVLAETAVSLAHAERTIQELVEQDAERVPTPAELRRLAWAIRPVTPTELCTCCGGTGWRILTKQDAEGIPVTVASKCRCRNPSI